MPEDKYHWTKPKEPTPYEWMSQSPFATTQPQEDRATASFYVLPTHVGLDQSLEKSLFRSAGLFDTLEEANRSYQERYGIAAPQKFHEPFTYSYESYVGGIPERVEETVFFVQEGEKIRVLSAPKDLEIPKLTFRYEDDEIHIYDREKAVGKINPTTGKPDLDEEWISAARSTYVKAYAPTAPVTTWGTGVPIDPKGAIGEWLYSKKVIGDTILPAPAEALAVVGLIGSLAVGIYQGVSSLLQIGWSGIKAELLSPFKSTLDTFIKHNAKDIAMVASRGIHQHTVKDRLLYKLYSTHNNYIARRANDYFTQQREAVFVKIQGPYVSDPAPLEATIKDFTTTMQTTDKVAQAVKAGQELTTTSLKGLVVSGTPTEFAQGLNVVIAGQAATAAMAGWDTTTIGAVSPERQVMLSPSQYEGGVFAIQVGGESVGAVATFPQEDALFVNRISIKEKGTLTRSILSQLDAQLSEMARGQDKQYLRIAVREENLGLYKRGGYTQEEGTNVVRKDVSSLQYAPSTSMTEWETTAMAQWGDIEGIEEWLATDPVASYTVHVGKRRVHLDYFLKQGDWPESFTVKEAAALMQKPVEQVQSKIKKGGIETGRVDSAYVLDEISEQFGLTEDEFIRRLASIRDAKQQLSYLQTYGEEQYVPETEVAPVTPEVTDVPPPTKPPAPPTQPTPTPPDPIDVTIKKLVNAIKAAGPARAETEVLKTAEIGRRVPRMREAALAAKPEEAGFAAMGQLKGELPKAQFAPPEAVLLLRERSSLFEYLRNSLLMERGDDFKWLHTDTALRKILAGQIPTQSELVLLEDAFGSELVEAILSKRPLSQKIWDNFLDVINIPRILQTINDLSAFFRQGAFIATAHPKIGARALVVDVKSFFSGAYAAKVDQFIRSRPYTEKLVKHKLYLGPFGEGAAARLSQREEMFMSRLIKRVPGLGQLVEAAERAYINTLNYGRVMVGSDVARILEKGNYPDSAYKELTTLINWATGRGPIGKLANMTPLLNGVFYAVRLQTSRWAMLFGGYKFKSPPVRKEYIRMMLSFFGTISGIVALGDLAGLWETEKDPRSSDFGKIRIGNTRLDPWAGFQPIARLIAQVITAERKTATGRVQDISRMETMERFLRSKASPAFGLAWDIIEGETFIGEALSLDAKGIREQAYQRLVSLFIQDMIDAIKEDGWIGGVAALPGILGVGVVTYPGSLDAYERHIPEIPDDMLFDWQRGVQGSKGVLSYQNLNVLQKSWLRRHCEEIGDTPERKEAGTYNFYEAQNETYEEFEVLLNEELQDVVTAYRAGKISLSDYIEQSEYTRNKYFGQASKLWLDAMREKLDPLLHKNLQRWHEEEIKPEDAAYEEYMALRANPPKVGGVPDWDAWDKALSEFLDKQTEESKAYINQRRTDWINNLPEDRQPIERLILDCEAILDDYYAIEADKRAGYRDRHPEVDARLIILRGLKPRSGAAQARVLLQQYGIAIEEQGAYQWTSPSEDATPPSSYTTPEEPAGGEPKYKWNP